MENYILLNVSYQDNYCFFESAKWNHRDISDMIARHYSFIPSLNTMRFMLQNNKYDLLEISLKSPHLRDDLNTYKYTLLFYLETRNFALFDSLITTIQQRITDKSIVITDPVMDRNYRNHIVSSTTEQTVTEAVEQPITETVEQPVTETVEQPVTETVEQPVTETVEQPVTETVEQPITETVEQPVTETIEQPVTEAVEEPVTETVEQPITETVEQSVTETVEQPIEEPDEDFQLTDDPDIVKVFTSGLDGYRLQRLSTGEIIPYYTSGLGGSSYTN